MSFQFHKVQLKGSKKIIVAGDWMFQFHKVQLKE